MTITDGLIGVVGAILLGSVLAMARPSPSRFRRCHPSAPCGACIPIADRAFDWTVIGLGAVGLIIVLSAIAMAIVYRQAPHRVRAVRDGKSPAARARRGPLRDRGCRRPPRPVCATRSNRDVAATRCRCVPRSSAPRSQSWWS